MVLYIETKYKYLPKHKYDKTLGNIENSLAKYKEKKPEKYKQLFEAKTKYIRIADETLIDKFNSPIYQLAFIHLLLPYAKKAFTSLELPTLRENFIEVCRDSDRMQKLLDDYYEITNLEPDRVTKLELRQRYESEYNVTISEETILSEAKRCGLDYERIRERMERRGVFIGVKRKEN